MTDHEIEKYLLKRVIKDKKSGCWKWIKGKKYSSKGCGGYGWLYWKGKNITASRLSAIGFLGLKREQREISVCHKCNNPSCINPEHLYLGNQSTNVKDYWDTVPKEKRIRGSIGLKGEKHHLAKLKIEDIKKIKSLYRYKNTQKNIAKMFSISQSVISRIVNNFHYAN